jgi:hypothetical protein
VGAAGADDAGAGEEEVAAKPKEKTIFNVKLESFDAGAKPKIIKEVKAIVPNLTLIEVRPVILDFIYLLPFSFAEYYCCVSRQRSLLNLCQRYSRRVSPRKMRRRSKRPSRRTAPSSSSSRQLMHYFSLSLKLRE